MADTGAAGEIGASSQQRQAVTRVLAMQAAALRFESIPANARELIRHCVLDYLGCTLAGAAEPGVQALAAELAEEGGLPQGQILGSRLRMPLTAAALLNGTASHALDYDDVNFALMGHPSVPVLPALLALAEHNHARGAALMTAFLAGYELENRIGLLVGPGHYAAGFHATATVGTFGAAAACAHLLGVDTDGMAKALGIAATQAAGLKSMFGTDCKPLHAGMAARSGLLAARLAQRGFTTRTDALECGQGFAATHGPNFEPDKALAPPPRGWHVLNNLFKYHASCYETHATIECALALRKLCPPARIRSVTVTTNPYCDRICNIAQPTSGLEAKFSLRVTASMALLGFDTASPASFTDALVRDPRLVELRDKTLVTFAEDVGQGCARVTVTLDDGSVHTHAHNAAEPMQDLVAQGEKLARKFRELATPVLGQERAEALLHAVARLEDLEDVAGLTVLTSI